MSDDSESISSDDVIYDPDNAHQLYYENGLLLFKNGNYEDAIFEFDKTVSLKPDHSSIVFYEILLI